MIRLKTVRWKNFLATGNQFLEEYVDGMKVDVSKPKVKKLLQVIYDEALNVDTTE